MRVLGYDQTETGPRLRKTLVDINGITPQIVRSDIGGLMISGVGTAPKIDLYTYMRPSNGQQVWFVECEEFYPPDAIVYSSWLLDEAPTDEQCRDIVATRPGVGAEAAA